MIAPHHSYGYDDIKLIEKHDRISFPVLVVIHHEGQNFYLVIMSNLITLLLLCFYAFLMFFYSFLLLTSYAPPLSSERIIKLRSTEKSALGILDHLPCHLPNTCGADLVGGRRRSTDMLFSYAAPISLSVSFVCLPTSSDINIRRCCRAATALSKEEK